MRWAFLIGGAIATAAMLCISMRLNYLFGFALGQTSEKALVFGWVSVISDAWKGLGPVFILTLFRAKRWPSASAAAFVWMACFIYSVSSALGVAIEDRSARTGGRERLHMSYEEARTELDRLEKKRYGLRDHRPVAVVEAAINAVLFRAVGNAQRVRGTVGDISGNCMRADPRTVEACAQVSQLRAERAAAIEEGSLDRRIFELREQITQLRNDGATLASDAQAEFFSRLSRGWFAARDVGPGLSLLLAIVIELVSAFGPVVLSAYANTTHEQPTWKSHLPRPRLIDYVAERIEPASGKKALRSDQLYADYKNWCAKMAVDAVPCTDFLLEFDRIRTENGIDAIQKFGNRYYGIRLGI